MEKGSGRISFLCKTAFLKEVAHATYETSKHFRDTVLKWGNLGEQNNPYPSPLTSFKNGVFSASNSNSDSTLHGVGGGGGGRKIPFFPLSLDRLNVQKVFLGQGVSLNFVADCKSVSDSSPVVFA